MILARQAAKLRKDTKDDRYFAPLDKKRTTLRKTMKTIVGTPFLLLLREPVLVAITVYMSVSNIATRSLTSN